jgi:hypothetical protein
MSLRLALSSTPAWKLALIPVLAVVLLTVLRQPPTDAPAPEARPIAEAETPSAAPPTRLISTLPELSLRDALAFDPFGQLALPVRQSEEPPPPPVPPTPVVEAPPTSGPKQPLVDRAKTLKELKVSAVFSSPKGPVAIIDSKTVRPGDLLSPGVRVVEIRGTNVILRVEDGEAASPEKPAEAAIR